LKAADEYKKFLDAVNTINSIVGEATAEKLSSITDKQQELYSVREKLEILLEEVYRYSWHVRDDIISALAD